MKTPLEVKPKQSPSFVDNLGRISLHCEFRVLYSRLFLIMATFRDDYQDIFGEVKVNDFEGCSREELNFNSDIEVEEYSENESEDSESENEDEAMQCSQKTGQKH